MIDSFCVLINLHQELRKSMPFTKWPRCTFVYSLPKGMRGPVLEIHIGVFLYSSIFTSSPPQGKNDILSPVDQKSFSTRRRVHSKAKSRFVRAPPPRSRSCHAISNEQCLTTGVDHQDCPERTRAGSLPDFSKQVDPERFHMGSLPDVSKLEMSNSPKARRQSSPLSISPLALEGLGDPLQHQLTPTTPSSPLLPRSPSPGGAGVERGDSKRRIRLTQRRGTVQSITISGMFLSCLIFNAMSVSTLYKYIFCL